MQPTEEYKDCWYCDNLISHPNHVMLLHLAYPKIKVMIKSEKFMSANFDFMDFYDKNITDIEYIGDPDESTDYEATRIALEKLWNFSILQEEIDEEIADKYL